MREFEKRTRRAPALLGVQSHKKFGRIAHAFCQHKNYGLAFRLVAELMNTLKNIGLATACVAVSLLLFMWPALYNGQPFIFEDTAAYISAIDAGAQTLGIKSRWSTPIACNFSSGHVPAPSHTARPNPPPQKIVLRGRSIYYGLLLYLGDAIDGWLSVALQALAAMLAIGLTLYECARFRWSGFAAICAGLAIFTPLAFFASFLMPDMFAGIAILTFANIAVFGVTMPGRLLISCILLLSASVLFHTSNLTIVAIMAAIALIYCLIRRRYVPLRAVTAIMLAIIVGFLGEAAFGWITKASIGTEPIRPPFLTARLLADGPGADYLKANCPRAGFAVCKFTVLLPVKRSDDFLWSNKPALGGFMLTDPANKRALGEEQYRFALAVAAYEPLRTLAAVSRDTLDQLGSVNLSEFNRNLFDWDQWRFFRCHLPPSLWAAQQMTLYWRGTMPVEFFSIVDVFAALASLAYIAARYISRSRSGEHMASPSERLTTLLLLGFLVNAFVCGVFSGPHPRYQARVLWLLPFAAVLLYREKTAALIAVNQMRD